MLTIVIPTKNPNSCLEDFINYFVKNSQNKNYKILVCVSCSKDKKFEEFYARYMAMPNIEIILNENYNMVDNWNASITHIKTKYVCFIGDDDGVSTQIHDVVKYMNENDVDSITPGTLAYDWTSKKGVVKIGTFKRERKRFDTAIKQMCQNGGYSPHDFPKLYYGIVKRECLDDLVRKFGNVFDYPSPDIVSATRLGSILRDYEYLDVPLFIGGSSSENNSGKAKLTLLNRDAYKCENIEYIQKLNVRLCSCMLPNYFCKISSWPIMGFQTLASNFQIKETDFNFVKNIVELTVHEKHFRREALKFLILCLRFYGVIKFLNLSLNSVFSAGITAIRRKRKFRHYKPYQSMSTFLAEVEKVNARSDIKN